MSKRQSKATQQENMQRASERAAAIRAEHERRERRTRTILVSAVVVGVLILVVAIFTAFQYSRDTTGDTGAAPIGAVGGYSLPLGPDGAKATVTVYEDFMCPYCGRFEKISEDTLKRYVDAGGVQVRYHVVSFLDDASTTDYSTRAANAFAVVLDTAGADVAVKFHNLLYAHQPQEGSAGLSDDELVALAVKAGASKHAISGPIKDLKFKQWVVNSTGAWSDRGFTGTPSVTVNGKKITFNSAEDLLSNTEKAIKEALAK